MDMPTVHKTQASYNQGKNHKTHGCVISHTCQWSSFNISNKYKYIILKCTVSFTYQNVYHKYTLLRDMIKYDDNY